MNEKKLSPNQFGEEFQKEGPDDRSEDRSSPSQQEHDPHFNTEEKIKNDYLLNMGEPVSVDSSRQGGEKCAEAGFANAKRELKQDNLSGPHQQVRQKQGIRGPVGDQH